MLNRPMDEKCREKPDYNRIYLLGSSLGELDTNMSTVSNEPLRPNYPLKDLSKSEALQTLVGALLRREDVALGSKEAS